MAAYELKTKIFGGFAKACHKEYKFESAPEQIFSILLKRDLEVQKWLRPALNQFKIIWKDGQRYKPDFVVETNEKIYIAEVKSHKNINDEDVKLKTQAAKKYCEYVNLYANEYEIKKFEYLLIPAEEISRSSTFKALPNKV